MNRRTTAPMSPAQCCLLFQLCILSSIHLSSSTSLTTIFHWTHNEEPYESQGKALNGHVIKTFNTPFLPTQCAAGCLKDPECMSFNFVKSKRTCELNNATHADYPGDVVDFEECEYHVRDAFSINEEALGPCFAKTCQNKGTCIEQKSGDQLVGTCYCRKGWMGDDCELPANTYVWSDWEEWNRCSVSCGTGYHSRTRSCINSETNKEDNVLNCVGKGVEIQQCEGGDCPRWSDWQEWGECTSESICGLGAKTRKRVCTNGGREGIDKLCQGAPKMTVHCTGIQCKGVVKLVDGVSLGEGRLEVFNDLRNEWGLVCADVWNLYSAEILCRQLGFSGVSEALTKNEFGLGSGQFAISTLNCPDYRMVKGLLHCDHNKWNLSETCASGAFAAGVRCKVDGVWSLWEEWGACSVTCEEGIQQRHRVCNHPPPSNGGLNCPGDTTESKPCVLETCPGNGLWLQWGSWSTCDKTCGGGQQIRTRECANPDVRCTGDSEEYRPCNTQSCPVDGSWKLWEAWSACSTTCGNGMQYRERKCDDPEYGGANCTGISKQEQPCKDRECPVDGVWKPWTAWGDCSVTCGNGTKTRSRACTEVLYGGKYCEGSATDTASCMPRFCPVDGEWEGWESWSTCSLSCGGGNQTRKRTCFGQEHDGKGCPGSSTESQNCNEQHCPVDGVWKPWTDWGTCTVTCAGGKQERSRVCDGPYYNGLDCIGNNTEQQDCNTHHCPVDGEWEGWLSWVQCDVTCGGGTQTRSRLCHHGLHGGKNCTGENSQEQECNKQNCPVDGKWEQWLEWSPCTLTCGNGTQSRTRKCIEPLYGGADCDGTNYEEQPCNMFPCPVDGEWKPWGTWSDCSLTCGNGTQSRTRVCQEPQHGGADCVGNASEDQACNVFECPVDGYWDVWTAWSECSLECGNGTQERTRDCIEPLYGGKNCVGENSQSQLCNTHFCPVDGILSLWSDWQDCSLTCGNGSMTRSRICTPPQHGGADCIGDLREINACFLRHCPVDGSVTEWEPWSQCTVTCGGGSRKRDRKCEGQMYGGKDCLEHLEEPEDCNINPCPVDGVLSAWGAWGGCTVTCGGGTKVRERTCSAAKHGGQGCGVKLNETATCNTDECPIDCIWKEWGEWNACSVSCGGGNQSHFRVTQGPFHGGADCEGSNEGSQACNEQPCPVDCEWMKWSAWGACTSTCGKGEQRREREKSAAQHGGKDCENLAYDTQNCNDFPCPVDGVWENWSDWDTCTVTCGSGVQNRSRSCTGPFHNGKACEGSYTDSQQCNTQECPVDGIFTQWSNWDTCSKTCGTGTQNRSRTCEGPYFGGQNCIGDYSQSQDCNTQECPVDGRWSEWSEYNECSLTCGNGTQTKNRTCIGPFYGGADCVGDKTESRICNAFPCPIAGDWFSWSEWTFCTVTCGGGTRTRNRTCDWNSYGELTSACLGDGIETEVCHSYDCLPLQPHCTALHELGLLDSVFVEIDPDGDGVMPDEEKSLDPFYVFCDVNLTSGDAYTVIGHNHLNTERIEGFEGAGSYAMEITYNNISTLSQLATLVDMSAACEQFLKWECQNAVIHHPYDNTWTTYAAGRSKEALDYFPGGVPGTGNCECARNNECYQSRGDKTFTCNCDNNKVTDDNGQKLEDSGKVTVKKDLPLTGFFAGDTGGDSEFGYQTIGPLRCTGPTENSEIRTTTTTNT